MFLCGQGAAFSIITLLYLRHFVTWLQVGYTAAVLLQNLPEHSWMLPFSPSLLIEVTVWLRVSWSELRHGSWIRASMRECVLGQPMRSVDGSAVEASRVVSGRRTASYDNQGQCEQQVYSIISFVPVYSKSRVLHPSQGLLWTNWWQLIYFFCESEKNWFPLLSFQNSEVAMKSVWQLCTFSD